MNIDVEAMRQDPKVYREVLFHLHKDNCMAQALPIR